MESEAADRSDLSSWISQIYTFKSIHIVFASLGEGSENICSQVLLTFSSLQRQCPWAALLMCACSTGSDPFKWKASSGLQSVATFWLQDPK